MKDVKVGDKVKAVSDGGYPGTVIPGELYEVAKVIHQTAGGVTDVKICIDNAAPLYMFDDEYEVLT